jgi:methylenetetrahydrofolate dehydrogenase (NADP+) / methenyltetrahydrofolate cyclohydrolase / formyltetrahydrofolate synthetase
VHFPKNLVNVFECHRSDSEDELKLIQDLCKNELNLDAVVCSHWAQGGKGAAALAEAVEKAAGQPNNFRYEIAQLR